MIMTILKMTYLNMHTKTKVVCMISVTVDMAWKLIDCLLLTLLFVMLVNARTVLTKQCVV